MTIDDEIDAGVLDKGIKSAWSLYPPDSTAKRVLFYRHVCSIACGVLFWLRVISLNPPCHRNPFYPFLKEWDHIITDRTWSAMQL